MYISLAGVVLFQNGDFKRTQSKNKKDFTKTQIPRREHTLHVKTS